MFIRTTGHLLAVADGIAPHVAAAEGSRLTSFPAELPADLVLPFDDFEDGDLFAHTGVRWQTFTDGVSSAALRLVGAGAAATSTAARLQGELAPGAVRGPIAQMYLPFDRGAVPVNLEHLGGVRFHVRSSRAFDVTFRCADGEFGKELEPSEEWRLVELGAEELMPVPTDAAAVDWNGTECVGLYLSRRGAANVGDFWFEIDEITFYGADAWLARRGPSRP